MEGQKDKAIVLVFWIATIGCLAFGYHNTALGLATFRALGSNMGSWLIALMPLIIVVGGYYLSVQSKKRFLDMYLTGDNEYGLLLHKEIKSPTYMSAGK